MRISRPHEEEHVNESWLIPYADILTLLLALFIILAASSQLDQEKFQRLSLTFNDALTGGTGLLENAQVIPDQSMIPPNTKPYQTPGSEEESEQLTEEERLFRQETEHLGKLQQQINAYIDENQLSSKLTTELNYEELKLKIQDSALFASGSATITGTARTIAVSIAKMLEQYPEYEIEVAGHTDILPINNAQFRSNWDLSAARALNFMKVLLENKNLDPKRFSTIGYGEHRPVAGNETAEGRAQNRRVEVSILRRFPQPETDAATIPVP